MNEWETTQHQAQNGLYGTGKGKNEKSTTQVQQEINTDNRQLGQTIGNQQGAHRESDKTGNQH